MSSNGTGGGRCFASEFKLTGEQPLHPLVIHKQHDEIDGLTPSLEAKVASTDRNECWCAPSMAGTARNHAATMFAADKKCALRHAWYHRDALGAMQHFFGNAFIRRRHDLVHDQTGCL